MILSGYKIAEEVQAGNITISPFEKSQINPNSYNYCLGESLLEIIGTLDPKKSVETKECEFSEEGFVLQPNVFYIAHTKEVIGSSKYAQSLIGRSSLGRLGLWLQVSADLGHVGNRHQWTLELKTVQPLRIYPGMKIGQVSFWRTTGEIDLYHGIYRDQFRAQASLISEVFDV